MSLMEVYIPSNKTKKFIELAGNVANQSEYPQFKHGAVLVKASSVINTAFNKNGYCSFGARFYEGNSANATLHAELASILNIERENTENSTVYTVRVNNAGEYRLSKPCRMCERAMRFCGVKRVVYSTNDGFEEMRLK